MCDEKTICDEDDADRLDLAERLQTGAQMMMQMLSIMFSVSEAYAVTLMVERDLRLGAEVSKTERGEIWLKEFAALKASVAEDEPRVRQKFVENEMKIRTEIKNERGAAT